MKTMYVVVRYSTYGFNIYTKTNSDKSKMVAYYEEQKARYNESTVILTTREKAKAMEKIWRNAHRNYGRVISRENKKQSAIGCNYEEEEEWVEE